jgi:carbamoyl-phosphate synthase large subunit
VINVLVSGVGGDVGQGVVRCLNKSNLNLRIFKISSSVDDSWLYCDKDSFISPTIYENYVSYLIHFINKHKIDIFFPCIDLEIPIISKNKDKIQSETNCKVFVDDYYKIQICNDKYMTSRYLEDFSLPYPETDLVATIDHNKFPVIIKSREGCGSKDIHLINSKEEIVPFLNNKNYIIQEYLDGDEYTAGVYLGADNKIKGVCVLKRTLKDGSTYTAERILNLKMEEEIAKIATHVQMKYLNIQFRLKNGKVCPFELNGRFSGTTGIISNVFNAPEMAIKELILKENISPFLHSEKFYVMRYYEEIFATEEQREKLLARSKND